MAPPQTGNEADRDQEYQRATDAAFRFLRYRGRSEAEVRNRLARRHDPEVIARVINTLREQGFLDDAEFARQWRDQRERRRPRGQGLLRQELRRLGVSQEVIREALENFDAGSNAYRAGRSLSLRLADTDYAQFRQRLWLYLQRRGFDSRTIGEAVQRLRQELSDLLDGEIDADAYKD